MRKHLNNLIWKSPEWVKNILFGLMVISVIAGMFIASTFVFWVKIQLAYFLFN